MPRTTVTTKASLPPPYRSTDLIPYKNVTLQNPWESVFKHIEQLERELAVKSSNNNDEDDDDDSDDSDYVPSSDGEDSESDTDMDCDSDNGTDEVEFLGVNLAPNPAILALAAPVLASGNGIPEYRYKGPWTAGVPYGVVPTAKLTLNPTLQSSRYYTVFRGRFVGVVTVLPLAESAVHEIPLGSMRRMNSQVEAVKAFNDALKAHSVAIHF